MPVSCTGTSSSVRTFSVTSSPVRPSPRVRPRTSRPFSYSRLIASPSIFSSHRYEVGPSSFSTRSTHAPSSSASKVLSRLSIRSRWSTARELRGERAADLLARRVRRDQARVGLLDGEQLVPQHVELAVGDRRRVEHVVAEAVAVDLLGRARRAAPAPRPARPRRLRPALPHSSSALVTRRRLVAHHRQFSSSPVPRTRVRSSSSPIVSAGSVSAVSTRRSRSAASRSPSAASSGR